MTTRTWSTAAMLGLTALVATACGGDPDLSDAGGAGGGGGSAGGGSIGEEFDLSGASFTVGSKEFTESQLLGQITIAALQAAGADVADQTGLTGTDTVRAALESGDIDMYWEYTGTGWVNILGNTTEDLPEDLYSAVAEADAANGVAWLEPAPFEDTYRIATTAQFAEENGLETTSDVAEFVQANPDQGTLCAASEFLNRDDGLPGLQQAYGFEFSEVVELDLGLIYTQVGESCNFGEVFSTDARILSNDLVVLEDDQNFFVPYNGALTVRQEVLDENPEIAEIMAPISEQLTDDVITELNSQVDNEGQEISEVAQEFLRENGFID
ncbi:glycine betaine ABC transporter substrate-binding protein [Geodermatophilus marinus]|uniref:glycine betaine ABC transporter substrate-binding protein n=1 Tax=Geodermatophilus sp. LHW52908 TaxID=2303986 RepID=UPI000E3D74CE|nr:glycine betaine ABC transporter substrate-binding protein [Geodermatophilus sp. LHW52908]RFU20986.1 glycine/betaine ABC transporter substrate-binding protein [Geodermatophilus sp. LHW52908]